MTIWSGGLSDDYVIDNYLVVQAKDCPVAMHTECAGLDKVPRGKWYCPEHAASQGKTSKPRPSSAKSSGNLDSTPSVPSNSGKAAASGASAPSKAGSSSKPGARGKVSKGRAHSEDDSAGGDLPKKGGKTSKGKAQDQEEAPEGSLPKKSAGKAGKKHTEAEQTDPAPKASSKSGAKLQVGEGSKANRAHSESVPTAAEPPARKKCGGRDFGSTDKPANGTGSKSKGSKGKDITRKRSSDEQGLQRGMMSASDQAHVFNTLFERSINCHLCTLFVLHVMFQMHSHGVVLDEAYIWFVGAEESAAHTKKKAPEGKLEAADISEKGSVKIKFKRLKKHPE